MSLYAIRLADMSMYVDDTAVGPWHVSETPAKMARLVREMDIPEGATVIGVRVVPASEITVTAEFLAAADELLQIASSFDGELAAREAREIATYRAERAKIGAGK